MKKRRKDVQMILVPPELQQLNIRIQKLKSAVETAKLSILCASKALDVIIDYHEQICKEFLEVVRKTQMTRKVLKEEKGIKC